MKLIKVKNHLELSKVASEIIIDEVNKKPNLTMGFATGKTPKKAYKNLIKAYKLGRVDFSKVSAFNLDEFYPIKHSNSRNNYKYLFNTFFNHINIDKKNIHLLNGETKNIKKECEDYEKNLKKSKIDLQILGIGENGHIGFNEPGSSKESTTRIVDLKHTKGKALTIGISSIMNAKKIILLASGKKKAKAIHCLVKGKVGSSCPASFLRNHKNTVIIFDNRAGYLI